MMRKKIRYMLTKNEKDAKNKEKQPSAAEQKSDDMPGSDQSPPDEAEENGSENETTR